MFNNEIQKQKIENNYIPIIIENTKINFFILGEWKFYQLESERGKSNTSFYSSKNEYSYLEKTLLVRSKYTNLELIGKHINESTSQDKYDRYLSFDKSLSFIYTFIQIMDIFLPGRIMVPKQQSKINHIYFYLSSIDSKRDASYEFCWSGNYYSKKLHHPKLEKLLKIHGKNIVQSLKKQNIAELEINLAPILSFCDSLKHEKERLIIKKSIVFAALVFYASLALIIFLSTNL
ncbi:MAG: hypothetical protein AAFQ80_25330 [Cyanobacteria bacterium J06621_8]